MITLKSSGGDDTSIIQSALNTGDHVFLDSPSFIITDSLTIRTAGQMLSGNGRGATVLKVPTSFNKSAIGIIVFASGEEGPQLKNFAIRMDQPDTNVRSNLINYPVAVYAANTARFTIEDLKISGAINGINMTGNCGGSFINLIEMSAFGTGITIDGSMDTVRINQYHFWNFDQTSNQAQIFYSQGTQAFDIGRVDGLFIHEFLNISNLGVNMRQGSTGAPWVYISNSGFDTYNAINQTAGSLQVINSYITNMEQKGLYGIRVSGSSQFAQYTNCSFLGGPANATPFIYLISGNKTTISFDNCNLAQPVTGQPWVFVDSGMIESSVSFSNSNLNFGTVMSSFLLAKTPSGQQNNIRLVNNDISTTPNMSYNNPIIDIQASNRVYMTGNRLRDKGANSSKFINIVKDDFNYVSGNMAPGWSYAFPIGKTGIYTGNI